MFLKAWIKVVDNQTDKSSCVEFNSQRSPKMPNIGNNSSSQTLSQNAPSNCPPFSTSASNVNARAFERTSKSSPFMTISWNPNKRGNHKSSGVNSSPCCCKVVGIV
ncbi:hypothetical protein OGAPHI_003505 [Ogataea philodendri]|uniref:Uncharacterized protein n=1 Tax=Ogataea philodendri TaxID=1378263 RepID=A0A9P8P896_9ASCO|nr:uncharacterized protein OGAPHI_003505 [Ogataea philodendri]KAH3666509.1 hypothetical protein OGAPHI_003505 [Ogataea philodendri]